MTIENLIGDARSLLTVASFLSFIGIVLWVYSGKHRTGFEAAARLPLDDDEDMTAVEKQHG